MVGDRSRLALPLKLALPTDDIVPRASDGDGGVNARHPPLACATKALKAFNGFCTLNTHTLGKTLRSSLSCCFSQYITE